MKRMGLFLLTNIAVMVTLSIILSIIFSVFGINSSSIGGLAVLAGVFGFGGAFISLLASKWMAKKSVGAEVIETPRNQQEQWLLETVHRQAEQAGIGKPEVAIYHSDEINAFATGAKRNDALVAVSTGLLNAMTQQEAEAVLAHEVSHIANGDMITMTLVQGIINTFVIFISRILAGVIESAMRSDDEESSGHGFAYFAIAFVLEILFTILAKPIVMWFSRQREYRADAGAAKLVNKEQMIAALERLKVAHEPKLEGSMMAFGINGGKSKTSELFLSHPPLDKRIEALRQL